MEKTVSEKVLKQVLNQIFYSAKEETRRNFSEETEKIKAELEDFASSPGEFYLEVVFQFEKILEAAGVPSDAVHVLVFYPFYKAHLQRLIELREGKSCSVDKLRYVLRKFLRHRLFGEEFRIDPPGDGEFQKPRFWTGEESFRWLKFIEGLRELFYGSANEFLEDLLETYGETIRKELAKRC